MASVYVSPPKHWRMSYYNTTSAWQAVYLVSAENLGYHIVFAGFYGFPPPRVRAVYWPRDFHLRLHHRATGDVTELAQPCFSSATPTKGSNGETVAPPARHPASFSLEYLVVYWASHRPVACRHWPPGPSLFRRPAGEFGRGR